ncbi:MAG: hypothetical protein HOH13_02830, partial [Crocinitomicaceae bacterium]|nr:hypothetical protein [Crocinitomicaceae bacterium]
MGNNQHFTASKLLFGIFALFLTISTNAQCPSANGNGMFDPESDILMTTYHSSIVKVTTGLVCWGEDLMPDGTADATAVNEITVANGYNFTGTIVHHAVSGNSGAQGFLATTTNLYAWGFVGEVVDADFVTGNSFAPMIGVPFASADIIQMHASSDVLFVVLNTGEVWVATTGVTAPNGTNSINGNIWHQVETSSGVPLTGIVQLTGNKAAGYALDNSGDIYAWGSNVSLGDAAGPVNLDFATLMVAPPSSAITIASIFGDNNDPGLLVLGVDTKIYGVGNNTDGEIITTGTGVVNVWTAVQDGSGSDFIGAINLATSHTSEDYPGVAVITAGSIPASAPTNLLYTWGQNETNSIGDGPNGLIADPTIPGSFSVGLDNPVSVSVGGHATTFFNIAGTGSICFVGHISNGSTGGLTIGTGTTFECILPGGITFCGTAIDTDGDGVTDADETTD